MIANPDPLPERPSTNAGEREALRRLRLIGTVSRLLAPALDELGPALDAVAGACVPEFCDLLAVELAGEGGSSVAAYRTAPRSGLTAPEAWTPVGRALAPERAVLAWDRSGEDTSMAVTRTALSADSMMVVPMTAGGVALGWLVLANGRRRRGFRTSASQVAVELAARIGTAVQRVLLYREASDALRNQQAAARRLQRLASAAASLSGAGTAEEVLRVACVEACLLQEASGAFARWRQASGHLVTGRAGTVDEAAIERVLAGAPAPSDPPWSAWPIPCSDPREEAALVLSVDHVLSPDEEAALSSLAFLLPVAFERAVGTEAALLHQHRLRTVLDASPVAFFAVGEDGSVADANEAAYKLFGREDADGALALPEEIRPALLEVAAAARAGRSIANRAVTSEGYDLSVSGWRRSPEADEDGSVALAAADLSERRRAERALVRAQRFEAMGQVAGRVAHDFNNLLTLITGYTALVQRTVTGPNELAMLAKIDEAAGRAAALTQQMLGFTRRHVTSSVVLDLAAALRELARVLDRIAGAGVAVALAVPDSPVLVASDPGEVEQIVVNLAINACDAMGHSGSLRVEVSARDVGSRRGRRLGLAPGRYARLRVADDGTGMAPDVLARCTEPFFTTKGRGRGSGLGLSTVYGLTAERAGTVAIESAVGSGTTVDVWLPCADRLEPGGAGDVALPRPGAVHARILLVEDEDDLRALAVAALEDIGATVVAAATAEEAALAAIGIDALVTDVVLPGESGVELAGRLRAERPDLPVLYMTGYAGDAATQGGLPRGPVLRKPYRPPDLQRAVAALVPGVTARSGTPPHGPS